MTMQCQLNHTNHNNTTRKLNKQNIKTIFIEMLNTESNEKSMD